MQNPVGYRVGLGYSDLEEGMTIEGTSITVTESHIVLFAGLSGDYNPLHVDEEYARKTIFGSRIAHGLLVMSLASGPLGMAFAGKAVALVEFKARFLKPARIGDTIKPIAKIAELKDDEKFNGGRVKLLISVVNQRGEVIARGEAILIVSK